jgi:hypothetical protein
MTRHPHMTRLFVDRPRSWQTFSHTQVGPSTLHVISDKQVNARRTQLAPAKHTQDYSCNRESQQGANFLPVGRHSWGANFPSRGRHSQGANFPHAGRHSHQQLTAGCEFPTCGPPLLRCEFPLTGPPLPRCEFPTCRPPLPQLSSQAVPRTSWHRNATPLKQALYSRRTASSHHCISGFP